MAHGDDAMIRRVTGTSGNLGQIRHRNEVVEYRVEQHQDVAGFPERVRHLAP
jgi:hypothetical protein